MGMKCGSTSVPLSDPNHCLHTKIRGLNGSSVAIFDYIGTLIFAIIFTLLSGVSIEIMTIIFMVVSIAAHTYKSVPTPLTRYLHSH